MGEPIIHLGENGEFDEDEEGNIVIRNTHTGVTITLAEEVEELIGESEFTDHTAATDAHGARGDITGEDDVFDIIRSDAFRVDLPENDSDLTLFVGGRWVGRDDPAEEFPDLVEDGHKWDQPPEG